MRLVVTDTGPLHYIVLTGEIALLPILFEKVLTPERVRDELAPPRDRPVHRNPLPQANAYMIIQRRSKSGEIPTKIGSHTFRATGVTAYLKNGGALVDFGSRPP